MENQDIYEKHFIYFPVDGKFILIETTEDIKSSKEALLINLNKFISCKQIKTF